MQIKNQIENDRERNALERDTQLKKIKMLRESAHARVQGKKENDIVIDRQIDRQIDGQIGRQIDRQIDRDGQLDQIDRQIEVRERDRGREINVEGEREIEIEID